MLSLFYFIRKIINIGINNANLKKNEYAVCYGSELYFMGRQGNYILSDVRDVYYLYKYWSKERKKAFWKQFTIENNTRFYNTSFPSGNYGNF